MIYKTFIRQFVKLHFFPPHASPTFASSNVNLPRPNNGSTKKEEIEMAKSSSSNRGQSSHPGPGGNWPSTTGNPSGGNRGNATPKGK